MEVLLAPQRNSSGASLTSPRIPSDSSPPEPASSGQFTNPFPSTPVLPWPPSNYDHWSKDFSDLLLQLDPQNGRARESIGSSTTIPPSIFSVGNYSRPETPQSTHSIPPTTPIIDNFPLSCSLPSDTSAEARRGSNPKSPTSTDAVPFCGMVKLYANPSDSFW